MKDIDHIIEDTIAKYREDTFNPKDACSRYLSGRNTRHSHAAWYYRAVAVAAITLVILTARFTSNPSPVEYTANGGPRSVVLPDQSSIILAEGSSLSFRSRNFKDNRSVSLEGKALFTVKHDASRPFTVSAGNAIVKDLGTEFQIDWHDSTIEVDVFSGEVLFTSSDNKENGIHLVEGMHAAMDNAICTPEVRERVLLNPKAWSDGHFAYNGASITDVLNDLESCYGVRLSSSDTTSVLTGTFEASDLDQITRVISTALDINIKKE